MSSFNSRKISEHHCQNVSVHLFTFGFVELLATVGSLGGSGTIESALRGGDVKLGVRLYKLLFEALYQLTLEMMEEVSLSSESKESIKLRKLV